MSANFTPTMEGYTNQRTFRYWCQTVLPLVYDDSLSYYELLNKVVNYLNNVISDVSNVETNVDALLTAYNQLQEYVNDYFENVDVQDEINNKLDAMAEDGSLSALIAPIVNQFATPEIVTSTAAMTDPRKLYILSSNGKVYTWNSESEQFVETNLTYGVSDLMFTGFTTHVNASGILDDADDAHVNRVYAISNNHAANIPEANGNLITFSYKNDPYSAGYVQIFVSSTNKMYSRIRWGASGGSWSEWVRYGDGDVTDKALTSWGIVVSNTERAEAAFNGSADADSANPNVMYSITNTGVVSNLPVDEPGTLFGFSGQMLNVGGFIQFYVTSSGVLYYRMKWGASPGTWQAWKLVPSSDDVNKSVKTYGTVINSAERAEEAFGENPSANNAATNTIYCIATAELVSNLPSNTMLGTLISLNGQTLNVGGHCQIFISSTGVMYFRIRWGASPGTWGAWQSVWSGRISNVESYASTLGIYNRIGVVGDSYASGEVYDANGNGVDNYYLSWGQIIARKLGNTCVNFSKGGLTTRSWLTDSMGLAKLNSEAACDIYLLNLGMNDANHLGWNYLGSLNDIHVGHPEQNPDTFCGNYAKIIEAIKTKNPNAHIVLLNLLRTNTAVLQAFNIYASNIGLTYNIPIIDTSRDPYITSDYFTNTLVNGHPDAAGYGGLAQSIERLFGYVTTIFPDYFKYYMGNT